MARITFDAKDVEVSTRTQNYLSVEVETDYINEVLDNFDVEEIIQNYSKLDELYEGLKEYFNND